MICIVTKDYNNTHRDFASDPGILQHRPIFCSLIFTTILSPCGFPPEARLYTTSARERRNLGIEKRRIENTNPESLNIGNVRNDSRRATGANTKDKRGAGRPTNPVEAAAAAAARDTTTAESHGGESRRRGDFGAERTPGILSII